MKNNKPNLTLTFLILSAFITAIVTLYLVNDAYLINFGSRLSNFYSDQAQVNEKKIFLMGSSHVGTLNETHIQEILLKKGQNYKVYPIQESADLPKDRLNWIDQIIAAKPSLVVYGLDMRNFRTLNSESKSPEGSTPLSIQQIEINSKEFLKEIEFFNNVFRKNANTLNNPKLTTLKIIDKYLKPLKQEKSEINIVSTNIEKSEINITQSEVNILKSIAYKNLVFLKENRPPKDLWGFINKDHENIAAVKQIVKNLQKNGIKVVLFATPQHEFYYAPKSNSDMQNYEFILKSLSKDLDVNVHDFSKKYWDLNVWADLEHVAKGTDIYDEDVTNLILSELN